MEIRSILVLVQDPSAAPAVRAAHRLARRHGASLVGLHVSESWPIASTDGADLTGQVYQMQREQLQEEAAQARQVFQSVADAGGVETEWRREDGATHEVTDLHARHCDLFCVSTAARGHHRAGFSLGEDLLFTVGRPALVVPAAFPGGAIGENVAIAWDTSRESARAVSDAMGILKLAESVSVVTVADRATSDRESGMIELDVCRYLAQHDVQAQGFTVHPGEAPVGEALHAWAIEQGRDLLVMGAYGHSRFRQMVLGGTTRWMMRHSDIPLLMSH